MSFDARSFSTSSILSEKEKAQKDYESGSAPQKKSKTARLIESISILGVVR